MKSQPSRGGDKAKGQKLTKTNSTRKQVPVSGGPSKSFASKSTVRRKSK